MAGALHRVEVAAAAVKLDRETELFHVRLLTGDDERVVAAMKVTLGRSYLARTGEGYAFWIRRQDVTLHELELVEGRELARDIAILVPRDHARDLLNELVAVCEFRVVAGADGLAATQSVQSYPMSVTEPLDGRVTTHVLRVALQSLTLRSARSGQVYRRIDANPVAAAGAGSAAARF